MSRIILSLAPGLFALTLVACGGSAPAETESTCPHRTAGDEQGPSCPHRTAGAEHGRSCPHHAGATAGAEEPLVPPGEAGIGDRSTCPVSGEEFVVSQNSPSVEHEGRTYYFCCPGCAKRFQADPAQYLDAQDEEEPAEESDRETD
jgi:YHS domain-containing protein